MDSGPALVAYSLMLVFLSNFNMGNLMVWVLTAVITVCAIWHKPLAGWLRTGAGRVVGIVLGVLLVVYLALIGFVAVMLRQPAHRAGAGHDRAGRGPAQGISPACCFATGWIKACEYAADTPDLLIVTSGGQGRDEWIPEARLCGIT